MSASEILEQIRRLPEDERRKVTGQILEEFGDFDDGLSPEQIEEAERRGERLSRNPQSGIPWDVIVASDELAPGEAEEIDRRLADHLKHPDDVVTWEEAKAQFDAKYKK